MPWLADLESMLNICQFNMGVPILSYIVPVYNTAVWLKECADSLLSHAGNNVEFIFIDDGSTDESPKILDEYAGSDNRIKVIRQKNMGLSASRNIGLKSARGKYVLFIDSDDYIDSKSVQRMLNSAKKHNADVVTGCVTCVNEVSTMKKWGQSLIPAVYSTGIDFLHNMYQSSSYVPMVFNYLVKRDLLTRFGLTFTIGILHEDELWTPQVLIRATNVVVTNENHYFYRINRPGSIMSTKKTVERIISLGHITRSLCHEVMLISKGDCYESILKVFPFLQMRFIVFYAIIQNLLANKNDDTNLICQFMRGHCMAINHFIRNSTANMS